MPRARTIIRKGGYNFNEITEIYIRKLIKKSGLVYAKQTYGPDYIFLEEDWEIIIQPRSKQRKTQPKKRKVSAKISNQILLGDVPLHELPISTSVLTVLTRLCPVNKIATLRNLIESGLTLGKLMAQRNMGRIRTTETELLFRQAGLELPPE